MSETTVTSGLLQTRNIGGTDMYDKQSIRIEGSQFAGKTGLLRISPTRYFAEPFGVPAGGVLDVRPANFNILHDVVKLTKTIVSPGAGIIGNCNYYVAINNGVPGPSVRVNQDGTWDLTDFTFTLPSGNTLAGVYATLNYTVYFTDLSPSLDPPWTLEVFGSSQPNFNLNIGPDYGVQEVEGVIGVDYSLINVSGTVGNGYIVATIHAVSVLTSPVYSPSLAAEFSIGPASGNGTPSVKSVITNDNWVSGELANAKIVIAVNSGKVDANGGLVRGTLAQGLALKAKLKSQQGEVGVSIYYDAAFTATVG